MYQALQASRLECSLFSGAVGLLLHHALLPSKGLLANRIAMKCANALVCMCTVSVSCRVTAQSFVPQLVEILKPLTEIDSAASGCRVELLSSVFGLLSACTDVRNARSWQCGISDVLAVGLARPEYGFDGEGSEARRAPVQPPRDRE